MKIGVIRKLVVHLHVCVIMFSAVLIHAYACKRQTKRRDWERTYMGSSMHVRPALA